MIVKTGLMALALAALAALPLAHALEGSGSEAAADSSSPWHEVTSQDSLEAALALAKDGKPVLLEFTGSDWCGWCKRLHKEVLDTPAFLKGAKDLVHLATVDMPKKRKLPAAEQAFKNDLVKSHKIEGYPTLVLLDASGKEIGRTGYQKGGPEKFLALLAGMIKGTTKQPEGSGGG